MNKTCTKHHACEARQSASVIFLWLNLSFLGLACLCDIVFFWKYINLESFISAALLTHILKYTRPTYYLSPCHHSFQWHYNLNTCPVGVITYHDETQSLSCRCRVSLGQASVQMHIWQMSDQHGSIKTFNIQIIQMNARDATCVFLGESICHLYMHFFKAVFSLLKSCGDGIRMVS